MTNELKILFERAEGIKGKNFTINDVYDVLNSAVNYYTPSFLRQKYIELKEELDEYVRNNDFTQSSE